MFEVKIRSDDLPRATPSKKFDFQCFLAPKSHFSHFLKPPLIPNSLQNKQECCVISCIYRICVRMYVCVCMVIVLLCQRAVCNGVSLVVLLTDSLLVYKQALSYFPILSHSCSIQQNAGCHVRAGNAGFIEGGGWAQGFPQPSEMKITVGELYRTIKLERCWRLSLLLQSCVQTLSYVSQQNDNIVCTIIII